VLRALHAEEGIAALRAGTVVAVGPDATDRGAVHVTTTGPPHVSLPPDALTLEAVDAGPTRWASLVDQYTYVISPHAAAVAGLSSEPNDTFVLRAPSDLTDADLQKAAAIVGRYSGASMNDVSSLGSQNGPGRWYFGIAGTLLALAIVGVIVALMGEESRKDRAIVSAVGAAPRTRRALAGASAWVVAAVAGTLAVPAGFVPVTVYRIAQARGYPVVVPWAAIAVAVLGVPIVAGCVAAISARQPKPMSLLRPIA
jgi:putative ABC transport system permease protein